MKRVLAVIEYNGTAFSGWQKNGITRTVEYELERAAAQLFGEKVEFFASGRTDAGVHAMAQTAHFDIPDCGINVKKIPSKLNAILPPDVRILSVNEVSPNFHARYNVKSKTYLYKCYTGSCTSPLREGYYAYIPLVLNLEKMRSVADVFVGRHDFKAFSASGGDSDTFEREIISIEIQHKKDEYFFYVKGKGFLYNMVRIIVGTIIFAGAGRIDVSEIISSLETAEKTGVGEKMPACGLYLYKVDY